MKTFLVFLVTICCIGTAYSQFKPNYDESKVPEYKLPDPLRTFTGKKVRKVKKWEKNRKPELLNFFTENVYGKIPGTIDIHSVDVLEVNENALNGKAKRKQVLLHFEGNERELGVNVLLYLPKNVEKAPVFIAYNFYGNHSITKEVDVEISEAWVRDNPSFGIVHNQLTEQSRGVRTNRWPVEKILEAGYGLATVFYCEVDPDRNDFTDGIHPFLYEGNRKQPKPEEWGSIAAWAWGLSRVLDYLEDDEDVDASRGIVLGHSRLGKTALWAGVIDERFAGVVSNNSGCGGAALSKRRFGETVWRINKQFPHWFCGNFKNYSKAEENLPVDQHQLISLIAPRPVYIASASEDLWADPKGEFLAALFASPVYELYAKTGLEKTEMPPVNQPIHNTVAYHLREGKHDLTVYDWEQYIKWANEFIK